jgi:hypothetical protein
MVDLRPLALLSCIYSVVEAYIKLNDSTGALLVKETENGLINTLSSTVALSTISVW